jgi:hypothetical protein
MKTSHLKGGGKSAGIHCFSKFFSSLKPGKKNSQLNFSSKRKSLVDDRPNLFRSTPNSLQLFNNSLMTGSPKRILTSII